MANVSIITASYNYQNYIKETIESVINQTYTDWEMIIVDDGSVDNSVEIIKSYCKKDCRIKLYQHENGVNKGLAATVKLGLEKSATDWIIFLESDDTITPNYIEEKLKIIKKYPDVKFIFNDVNMFGDKKIIKKYENNYFTRIRTEFNKITFPSKISVLFEKENVVPTFSVVMLKKEILSNISWVAIQEKAIDYHLWSQLAPHYKFYYLNKKLTNWRMSKKSYINSKISVTILILSAIQIFYNLCDKKFDTKKADLIVKAVEHIEHKLKRYKKLYIIFLMIACFELLVIILGLFLFLIF